MLSFHPEPQPLKTKCVTIYSGENQPKIDENLGVVTLPMWLSPDNQGLAQGCILYMWTLVINSEPQKPQSQESYKELDTFHEADSRQQKHLLN